MEFYAASLSSEKYFGVLQAAARVIFSKEN